MSSFNKVILMGRLTRDPELRCTPQGVPVSDLPLAVNRNFNTASGERREEVLFIDATVWRKQAEVCCQYLKKGNPILVEGHLSMDTWEGKDGQKQRRYRVVVENFQFVGSGGGGRRGEASGGGGGEGYSESGGGGDGEPPAERSFGSNYRQGAGGPAYGGNRLGASQPSSAEASAGAGQSAPDDDIPF